MAPASSRERAIQGSPDALPILKKMLLVYVSYRSEFAVI